MNKKILAGLFAIVFVVQAVQAIAISKMSDSVKVSSSTLSQQISMISQRQVAAVGVNSIATGPTSQGIIIVGIQDNGNGTCNVVTVNTETHEQTIAPTPPDVGILGNVGGAQVCAYGIVGVANGDIVVSLSNKDGGVGISSHSTVLEGQYKLMILGYLDEKNLTGKIDTTTQNAFKLYQKTKGLRQTGVHDTDTKNMMDKQLSGAKLGWIIEK